MKRRRLLSALGSSGIIGLAGCVNAGYRAVGAAFGDGEIQRKVSLADQDPVADDLGLQIDVELVESTITDTQPARLRITTTNEGPERKVSIGDDRCGLLNRDGGGSDEPVGLWLYRPERARHIKREADRWVRDASPDQHHPWGMFGCRARLYEPSESVSNEYVLWDDYQVDGYLTPGTYRWEEDVEIWDGPSTDHDSTTITWGFTLAVEKPD